MDFPTNEFGLVLSRQSTYLFKCAMRYLNVSQCAGGSSFSASWRISSCSSGSVVSETQMFMVTTCTAGCHAWKDKNGGLQRRAGPHSSVGLLIYRTYPNLFVEDLPIQRCLEHGQDVIGFRQRKLPKNYTPKDSLQPTKKNPLAAPADWTSFAQTIYRCSPGTAEGTGNFAISFLDGVHTV